LQLICTQKYHIPYEIVLDPQSRIAKAFGSVSIIPQTFFISKHGHIVFEQLGLFDIKKATHLITQNL